MWAEPDAPGPASAPPLDREGRRELNHESRVESSDTSPLPAGIQKSSRADEEREGEGGEGRNGWDGDNSGADVN